MTANFITITYKNNIENEPKKFELSDFILFFI